MLTAVLVIRFHYEKNDPRFDWRFNYFKNQVLPRVLAQTDRHFDIAIRCHPFHEQMFKSLSPRIKTFQVKNEAARYKTGKNGKKYFEDFAPWSDVVGLEKYDIQMGLDSDDLISNNYVKVIKKAVEVHGKPQQSLHIHFQPMTYNIKTKIKRPMMKYGPTRGSAFMALYQPDKGDGYRFIYERSHISLHKFANKSILLPAGHCWASVHNLNESTGVTRK